MSRIPEATIHEIRNRVDIVDLIGRHVDLKKAGRNFVGLCPFHNRDDAGACFLSLLIPLTATVEG